MVNELRLLAQAVSRRIHTAAARVRAQVRSCGICGGQRGTRAGFLRALLLPLSILIPPTTSPFIIYHPGLADVPSRLSLTPPHTRLYLR
jgi:hypothetical protein